MAAIAETVLLEGSFDQFSIDDVLDIVGISRQVLRLVVDGGEGVLVVQSGQVLKVEVLDTSGPLAFQRLYHQPGKRFAVMRQAPLPDPQPLGTLIDLVKHARSKQRAGSEPTLLEGSLAKYPLDQVFDVVGTSRQTLRLALIRSDGSVGTIVLKAGRVLTCEDPGRGLFELAAFRSLSRDPGERFAVTRITGPVGEPLGTLHELRASAVRPAPTSLPPAENPEILLDGKFSDFTLYEMLEVVSITRQRVVIVFLEDTKVIRGRLTLKGGVVLGAEILKPRASGRDAFFELMARPGIAFQVLRRPTAQLGSPIGTLVDLVEESRRPRFPSSDFDEPPTVVHDPKRAEALEFEPRVGAKVGAKADTKTAKQPRDAALEAVLARLDADRLDERVAAALEKLESIELRLVSQERLLAQLSRRTDRWLVAAVLLIQVLTVASIAVLFLLTIL